MFTIPEYYRTTRFRIDSPTDFPLEFVILTAHATTGQVWTDEQNQNADQRLEAELRALGHEPQRITFPQLLRCQEGVDPHWSFSGKVG